MPGITLVTLVDDDVELLTDETVLADEAADEAADDIEMLLLFEDDVTELVAAAMVAIDSEPSEPSAEHATNATDATDTRTA